MTTAPAKGATVKTVAPDLMPPALDIDMNALARYGRKLSTDGKIERRVTWNLLRHLEANDFKVVQIYDGDEFTDAPTIRKAMELIFDLDEVSVRVRKWGTAHEHGILLVLGNGMDILSDWTFAEGDADGFNAVMDAFEPGDFV